MMVRDWWERMKTIRKQKKKKEKKRKEKKRKRTSTLKW